MNYGEALKYIDAWMEGVVELSKMTGDKQFNLPSGLKEQEFNAMYKTFGSMARARSEEYTFSTVASQSEYSLPSYFKSLDFAFYNQGVDIWMIQRVESPQEVAFAKTLIQDQSTFFSLRHKENKIALYPAPSVTGDTVTLFIQCQMPDLTESTDELRFIPEDYHQAICDFVISRLSLLFGFYDQAKVTRLQLSKDLDAQVYDKANKLRKQIEFTSPTGRVRDPFLQCLNKFAFPTVNHSPIVNIIRYLNELVFRNEGTGYTGFSVDDGTIKFRNDVTDTDILTVTENSIRWMGNILYERSEIDITSDDFDYTFTGEVGENYELQITAQRLAAPVGQNDVWLRVNHYSGVWLPALNLISNAHAEDVGGAVCDITVTPVAISDARLTINVKNSNGGKLYIMALGRSNVF